MNKEVNYVLQGFLITLVLIGAFKFSGFLLSIPPPPPEEPDAGVAIMAPTGTVNAGRNNFDGRMLFQDNCASCHSILKDLTGPALAGVRERIPDKKLLYKWVRNPAAVLKSGNVYFNTLKKQFGNVQMTPFSELADEEIDAIIDYVDRNGPGGY
jgi:cytochrome c2